MMAMLNMQRVGGEDGSDQENELEDDLDDDPPF